jgi:hypothetical protein
MIGFSIEFKRWYITLRGPRCRVYLCTGFAKRLPVFISPAQAFAFDQAIDDSHSAILADEWREDETDEELLDQLNSTR